MDFLNSVLFFILSITLYQSIFHLPIVAAKRDVLNIGDEVNTSNSTSYLISASGKFTLGFFTIPSTSNFTYLGIWYTDEDQDQDHGRKVWVANGDIPIFGSGVLMIDDSGTLKVVNGSGTALFDVSYNQVKGAGNKTRAVLKDSGNFLVYDASDNRTLWQSFDYPTDTLLPGMKLGYNLTTKQNWTLTSWLSDQVPATGAFTVSLEQYQNSSCLIIHRHGEIYWASAPWIKDHNTFGYLSSYIESGISGSFIKSPFSFQYNMSLISDPSGMYFTFQTILPDSSTLQLSSKGQFIEFINGANNFNLTPPYLCHEYRRGDNYSPWCTIHGALPNCRSEKDGFASEDWNLDSSKYEDNSGISLTDCMERCWKDCNCTGFTTTNSNGTGCRTWSGDLDEPFQLDESGQTVHLKYCLEVSHNLGVARVNLVLSSVAFEIILPIIAAASLCRAMRRQILEVKARWKRDELIHQLTRSDSFNYGDELEKGIKDAPDVKIFSLKAILAATNNFSSENKLGQGGYGPVYKGKLFDGREIAVKRLSKTSGQGIEEFKSELILISKVQHTNLVRLYGCCIHQVEKMLIYEFMPNNSLDFFLFDVDKKEKIDWQMRFSIIEGVVQGLLYLHKYSRMKVIHRDLKASNVLLDENMNPKIADFGLARIFQQNVTEGKTNRVVGTYGYMAPEYAMEGTFSIKSDVFSFGVLVLEIVSGRKNSSFYNIDRPLNLVGYAWKLWKEEAALELKDDVLGESYDIRQLLRTIHVGLLCVQEDAEDRPTMSDVISMLNNEITDLPNPKEPAFFSGKRRIQVNSSETKDKIVSLNGLTMTTIGAR